MSLNSSDDVEMQTSTFDWKSMTIVDVISPDATHKGVVASINVWCGCAALVTPSELQSIESRVRQKSESERSHTNSPTLKKPLFLRCPARFHIRMDRVHRDPKQPRRKRRSSFKSINTPHNSQKNILSHIICSIVIQHHLKHHIANRAQMPLQHFFEKSDLPGCSELVNQMFIRISQNWPHSQSTRYPSARIRPH